ncbi:nitrate ABC transporter [Shewanella sp. SNU WT4]|uniref:ABC transporter substrate-binding protein n=1 Tax=Shewanella sp. SNU WT4 TaxID=2590015 RepID=UPI001126A1E2|nr:ABC transporter substrate-binding protein [Shewanella sp. SNU WT4]QDF65588.1 nitrate ABC transporter [Shewanella sp. SNU WT4]
MQKLLWILVFSLLGCGAKEPEKVTLAINPWPGYELLYLAHEKGFLRGENLQIELMEVMSLADSQRAYLMGNAEGFASTMIEATQVASLGGEPVQVVLLTNYSSGGDVVLGQAGITSMKDLKGKLVGCEVGVLGIYILSRALALHGMSLADVNVINVEQADSFDMMNAGKIDAVVTYAPFMSKTMNIDGVHPLFSSLEVPGEIIDVVSFSQASIKNHPDLVPLLKSAWEKSLAQLEQYPEQSMAIMAKREGVSVQDYAESLKLLTLLPLAEQQKIKQNKQQLKAMGKALCQALNNIGSIESDCKHMDNIFN